MSPQPVGNDCREPSDRLRVKAMARAEPPVLAGIFAVDKPLRMSSMRAVETVRRRAGGVRTGHAGTLDPLATGVLVMALGKFTRHIEALMATEKRYETRVDLSAFTTTDDSEGERTDVAVTVPPTHDAIAALLEQRFTGSVMQAPPAFSAVKLGGKRAYQLARTGQAPAPAPRAVQIHSVVIAAYEWPYLDLAIHCGKGTYVRSIARDLGTALGTGGTCASIRRTAVGSFTIDRAVPVADLPDEITQAWLYEHGVPQGELPA